MSWLSYLCCSLLIVLLSPLIVPVASFAQTVNLGDDVSRPIPGVGHDYVQGLSETVNPANGNVHVHIDLPVPKARGLTLPFAITYDSGELYHFTSRLPGQGVFGLPLYGGNDYPTDRSQAGSGWSNTLPYTSAQGFAVGVPMAPYYGNNDWQCPMSSSYNFYDPNGGSHMLGLAAIGVGVMEQEAPLPSTACAGLTYQGVGYAYYTLGGDDQVYGQMDAACNGAYQNVTYPSDCQYAAPAFTVTDLSGTVYLFPNNSVQGGVGAVASPGWPSFIFPAQIEDRNGNIINFTNTGGGYGLPITDTLGRVLVTSDCTGAYCPSPTSYTAGGLTYTLQYANTGSATFSVGNTAVNNPPPSGCGFSNSITYSNRQVLTSITLPNGQSYSFGYDKTYGLLNQITYPDGGWVSYTWGLSTGYSTLGSFNSSNDSGGLCNYEYQTPVITQRQVGYSAGSAAAQTQIFNLTTNWVGTTGQWSTKNATVTTTDNVTGNELITKYTYGYVNQPYQPNSSGQIVSQLPVENNLQYLDANNNVLKTVTKTWADQFEMTSEVTALPNVGTYGVAYCYRGDDCTKPSVTYLGAPVAKYEYDFGQVPASMPPASIASPGTASRSTVYGYYGITLPCHFTAPITYQTNPVPCPISSSQVSIGGRQAGLPPMLSQIVTYAGSATYSFSTSTWSGTRMAETDALYDGQATSPVSGLPSGTHDESNYTSTSPTSRGNPTTIIKWASIGSSPTVTFSYDETGQVVSRRDACGNTSCSDMTGSSHTTTYSYADSFSSGTPSGKTNAYLTKVIDQMGHTQTFSYDLNSGQLTVSKDQNDINANRAGTTYTYNTPPASCSYSDGLDRLSEIDYPDTGKTSFCYNDASPSITTTKAIASGLNQVSTVAFDGMGHVVQSTLSSDPDGSTSVDTKYTGMGSVYTQSNPHRSSILSTDGTTTNAYDGLGRTIAITRPDGSDVDTSYSGNCATTTDEVGAVRRSCSDGLGRLTEVDEPGSGGQTETAGSGAATVGTNTNGEQSKVVPATPGTGNYTIIGNPPPSLCGSGTQGYITISVSGSQVGSAPFYTNSTQSSVGLALVSSINNNGSSPVTATGGNTLTLTSKGTGLSTNYSVSAQPPSPTGQCTSMAIYGPTQLAGGTDPHTAYDSGSVVVTVNGVVSGIDYGQYDSTATVASALIAAINGNASSTVTATPNGSNGITLTANDAGASSDYTVSTSVFWSTSLFTQPSFTISAPSALSGGQDSTLGTGPLVTLYTYDVLNNLTCAVQKGSDTTAFTNCAAAPATWRPRSFVYDSLSRLTSATNPESGTILYTYDANGNVSTKTAPAPNHSGGTVQTSYSYDALNRLTKKSYSDGTPTVQYGYDAVALTGCTTTPPSLSDPNPIGRRTAMCDGSGATSWSHDKMGRTAILDRTIGAATRSASYQYNLDGSLALETIFSGKQLQYTYGGAGRVLSVTDPSNTPVFNFVTGAKYAPNGALTGALYGFVSGGFTGITETDAYNARLQPVQRLATSSAGTAINLCYDFHLRVAITSPCSFPAGSGDNGNVFQIVNGRDATRTQNFTYDKLNRITSAYTTSSLWGTNYGIDFWGNLTNITPMTGKMYQQNPLATTASTKNQLNSICQDAAGNTVFYTTCPAPPWSMTPEVYDAENRLKTVIGAYTYVYIYDGDGNRVEKKASDGTGTIYWRESDGELTNETDLNNVTLHRHVYFDGRRVCRTDTQPTTTQHFYFSDQLGSANVVASGTDGSIENDSDFYPYGGELVFTNNVPQNYKYTGKERDSESGLDNFGARYNASSMGRFMTPDPLPWVRWQHGSKKDQGKFAAYIANPQNLNLFAYVLNNPLNKTDPTGMYQCNGTAQQCAAVKAALDAARAADANLQAGTSGKALLDKVLQFYGAENTNNGVNINFNNPDPNALGSTSTHNGVTTISLGANALTPLTNTGKAETVAHEGTHGVDQKQAGQMPHTFWQFYDTEYHAYQTESAVDKGLGKANETDENPAWFPGITPQQRTTNITRDAYSNACFDVGGCP